MKTGECNSESIRHKTVLKILFSFEFTFYKMKNTNLITFLIDNTFYVN